MMSEQKTDRKKRLRTGFTTGTCAAGAAKAATLLLLEKAVDSEINVTLPDGSNALLPLKEKQRNKDAAVASIIKDGGDDPDITTGLPIVATVTLTDNEKINISGGNGVGTITLKGLKRPVGEAAINPVPLRMIEENVRNVLPQGRGANIEISVPGGEEIAKKTFNPKLGIVGGISILGSTGIVHPMSEDALTESLRLELSVLKEKGYDKAIFAFGNYGLNFLRSQGINEECVVKISNYIGFMLDRAMEMGFKKILLVGHLGKLVKVAGGIFQTHSRKADCRMEILTAYAGLEGADASVLKEIYDCKTTSAAADIIAKENLSAVYKRITANVTARCNSYTYDEIAFGTMLFGDGNVLLCRDEAATTLLKELKTDGQ